jgi:hypothetical protein
MSSITVSNENEEEEEIKKKLNDIKALMNNTLYITVKTNGKYSGCLDIIQRENYSNFKELIKAIPTYSLKNINNIEIKIEIDSNSVSDSPPIDFNGLKDIGLSNKSISVNISPQEELLYLSSDYKEEKEKNENKPIYLPNISTDVIFNRLDIQGVSIKNNIFPFIMPQITEILSVSNCRFNNYIGFWRNYSENTNSSENITEKEKFNYTSIRFENNTFEKHFTLQSIEFNEKFIFIENIFKKQCMIVNNEFKENFKFKNNNIENELYLINNTFTKDCKLSNNTFEKKCILSQNNFLKAITLEKNVFKEVLDLSSSSFAGALYLANSTFKEGIITYNIKFISSDTGKKISPEEYTNNCFVDINFDNLNNFRLSAGIIKSNLINSHNKIDASIWLAVELFIQTKILSLSNKDFGEWVVFSISGLVSNHQQNIMRPFGWLIAIFLVTSMVYNYSINATIYYDISSSLLPIYNTFNFSSPLDFINPFLQNYEIPKKSSSFGFGLKLLKILVNAFVTYIIWHIIQTSRSKIK